jgi:hypothetical protein
MIGSDPEMFPEKTLQANILIGHALLTERYPCILTIRITRYQSLGMNSSAGFCPTFPTLSSHWICLALTHCITRQKAFRYQTTIRRKHIHLTD